jgi:peptidoglycan/xylan/chitin deacetylase (PgdA/CDA1 family)
MVWKTSDAAYLADVQEAASSISSNLFRPPYGKITSTQAQAVRSTLAGKGRLVMWDVLSGDFDTRLSGEECFTICKKRLRPGSIIVLHDSEKAWPRLSVALPLLLSYALNRGFTLKPLQ